MGIQQILLIVLSVIILGTATTAMINYFIQSSKNTNRQCIIGELQMFASKVMHYYKTPRRLYGGGLEILAEDDSLLASFIEFTKDDDGSYSTYETENAMYELVVENDLVKIIGISQETGNDKENPIRVELFVKPEETEPIKTTIVN